MSGGFFSFSMFKNVNFFISGFMVIMCLILSYYLIFTDLKMDTLNGFKRQMCIAILLLYGFYRGFRLYTLIKNSKKEEEE